MIVTGPLRLWGNQKLQPYDSHLQFTRVRDGKSNVLLLLCLCFSTTLKVHFILNPILNPLLTQREIFSQNSESVFIIQKLKKVDIRICQNTNIFVLYVIVKLKMSTEIHFLMRCTKLKTFRENHLVCIFKLYPNAEKLNDTSVLHCWLQPASPTSYNSLSTGIHFSKLVRKLTLFTQLAY